MKHLKPLFLYIILQHLCALLFMTFFRVVFFYNVSTAAYEGGANILHAFLNGLWFDNVIASYITLPLCLLLLIYGLWGRHISGIMRGAGIYLGIMYTIIFMCEAANIPYFNYFTKIINSSIWEWKSYVDQTAGMIFGESTWRGYIALYIIMVVLFAITLRLLRTTLLQTKSNAQLIYRQRLLSLFITLPLIGLTLLGARGRLGYNPIKVSSAYYCDNTVLNQLGINPAFSLLTSTLDDMRPENRSLHLMPAEEAIRNVQHFLGRQGDAKSPLAHYIAASDSIEKKNIVFIIMESLSAQLMDYFGNPDHLTPYLDSLFQHSVSFDNFYSAGNHTNHGLRATLYSLPSILKRNDMKGTNIPRIEGLPTILSDTGYETLFFMAHEGQYDNMNGFFRTNGFNNVYSQENYPKKRIVNHFGVSDNFLFSFALDKFNHTAATGAPFFGAIMTMSNHPPYVIPDTFHAHHTDPEKAIVEYSDACIKDFLQAASRQPWYKNTLFVLLGDHGKKVGDSQYEVNESFNHVPLILLGSNLPDSIHHDFCGQIDVAPTVLGLLGLPYRSAHFGIDILKEHRPAMFYCADEVVCARNDSSLFIYNPTAEHSFCYDISTTHFRPMTFGPRFAPLKKYAFSNLQAAEQLYGRGQKQSK